MSTFINTLKARTISGQAPVAHTCNPSYSGGRDQEDQSSKPTQANSLQDPILKKTHHKKKRASGMAQGVGPEFKTLN
jgi:hypothetical protein